MNPQRSAFSAPPAHFLAEWYHAGLTEEHLDRIAARLADSAASTAPRDPSTRLLTMLAVPSDEVVFGVFAADSAQDVVTACLRAGLPVDRLTPAAVRGAGDRIDGPLRGR